MRKLIRTLLIGIMLVLVSFGIAACTPATQDPGNTENPGNTEKPGTDDPAEEITYTVTVLYEDETGVESVSVRLLKDGELQNAAFTNADGVAEVTAPADVYTIELGSLPEGYRLDGSYTTDAEGSAVTVQVVRGVMEGPAPAGHTYALESAMYDFTYTESKTGEEKSLSQLLEEKNTVLLNFWYVGCTWCQVEFPLMQEAYLDYEDDLAIVAINPFQGDDTIASYMQTNGLTFDGCYDTTLYAMFGVSGYPTNVIIDRYGTVCEIEAGGITDADIFRQLFAQYTADDYVPDPGSGSEMELPDVEAPAIEDLAAVLNGETAVDFTYRHEELEYNWPWVISDDGQSIHTSNIATSTSTKSGSYSILYLDATLDEGEVLAFDYKTDTQAGGDVFYVFIDGEIMYEFSGNNDWTTLYAFLGDGDAHEYAFAYYKDATLAVGEDTVWMRNMRITSIDEMVEDGGSMEIMRWAAAGYDASDPSNPVYTRYAEVVYNEEDGYYHVRTEDGPYLLAEFNEETLWGPAIYSTLLAVYNSIAVVDSNGNQTGEIDQDAYNALDAEDKFLIDNYDFITDCAWLGRFSDIMLVPVDQEIKDFLVELVSIRGNDDPNDNETEWLEICRYLDQYGDYEPMIDPVLGLNNDHAIEMVMGAPNHVTINKIFVPRGMRYRFVPEESGTYIFYSTGEHVAGNEPQAWLFDADERLLGNNIGGETKTTVATEGNFEIVANLVAGETYYLACEFFMVGTFGEYDFYVTRYSEGTVILPIAEGMWTTSGDDMAGEIVLPLYVDGVEYIASEDMWYVVNDDGTLVSPVLIDFASMTNFSDDPLTQWIEEGRFDFSGNGHYSLEDYSSVYELIPEADRIDYTDVMQDYADSMNSQGYVVADGQVVDLLIILMRMEARWTPDVAWLQLCYYAYQTV